MRSPLAVLADHRPGAASVPVVEWPTRARRHVAPGRFIRCPNCQSSSERNVALIVRWKIVTDAVRRMALVRCPDCTALFFENQGRPDYTDTSLLERGRVPFYIQQGAGVSLLTRPLARLNVGPGASYLDVGCGFGFGLDFAVHARGWIGQGIDPAPLASLGRELLGLDIAARYLAPSDAAGRALDVVMSSETIEHVASPPAFLSTLRWALKPGGVLVLTTPDAGRIEPSLPPETLVPLLSPGLHLVLQNEASLRALLLQTGFVHVVIERDATSLVAYASDDPFTLESNPAALRPRFRDYLEQRAASSPPASDLFLGMAGRALGEAVSDGDMQAAARAWAMLAPAVRDRFGLDLDDPALPPQAAVGAELERQAELMPLNLGCVLYARAMLRLAQGESRPAVEAQFLAAARAADAMRGALHRIAIDDMQTADIGWVARAEAVLCAADRGAPDIVASLAALPPAPDDRPPIRARRNAIAARALTALVNRSHYDQAKMLAAAERLQSASWDGAESLGPVRRDALFCLAVLDLQPGGNAARARARMRRVCQDIEAYDPHAAASLLGAALAGQAQAARALGEADAADPIRTAAE